MSLADLAALVSRGLAVYCAGHVIGSGFTVGSLFLRLSSLPATLLAGACTALAWLLVGLFLWFRAASFGTWIEAGAHQAHEEIPVDRLSLARAVLKATAVYWIVASLTDFLYGQRTALALVSSIGADNPLALLCVGHAAVLAGAVLTLVLANRWAEWLCK